MDQCRASAIALTVGDVATEQTPPTSIVALLPKAELHLHLEGSIRPDTAVELAARHGTKLTREEVLARYNYSNFMGFIETFKWITSFLRTPDDYALITRHLAEELLRQNVVYAEITISAGVVAFGMGGDELAGPTTSFRPAFDYARQDGLRIVCHAGEIGGPDSVREAVEILGAERIGHGIAVMNDPALAESLITRRVVLENCPSSNLCTGALAKQTGKPDAKLKDHPLPKFLEQGLLVTLSTDDPALFHTDLLREYALTESLGLPRK